MYRTYSYNDMPVPVQRRNDDMRKPMPPPKKELQCKENKIEKRCEKQDKNGGFLSGIATDDLILIVVALVLLIDDCDDKLLLIALAFIFLSEWF